MSEQYPRPELDKDTETFGKKLERLREAYYSGEDVSEEIKDTYARLFRLWFNRTSFGVEVNDNLEETLSVLAMMLPEDEVPKPRLRGLSTENGQDVED